MKKILYSILALTATANALFAKSVDVNSAKQVAENFLSKHAKFKSLNLSLAYTEKSQAGDADYYVFDLNYGNGFIIISAEDAGHPVIGYSTEGRAFAKPSSTENPEFNFWIEGKKKEIEFMRSYNILPTSEIKNEWSGWAANKLMPPSINTVSPLCATNWNQNGGGSVPYNADCPGGSVTGCVATAMAQIMKKWNYPATGTGSSSYNSGSYGTLSANYGATTYNWANMPNNSSNADVALISYHCGVSVDMAYSPNGSGAQVCGGNPSAQYSYVTYFKYDPAIVCKAQATEGSNWITELENEFNAGRPMQYQGVDASAGGHTWVGDGYDASNNIHMNWGWGGYNNGYYSVTNLNPSGYNFSQQTGGLINIKPIVTAALDAGIGNIISPSGAVCSSTFSPTVQLNNFGNSTALTSCDINYHVDASPNQTYHWTGSLAVNASTNVTLPSMTVGAGTHTLTASTSNPNSSTDGNATNDQSQTVFSASSTPSPLPLAEDFESSTSIPSGWNIIDMNSDGFKWTVSTTVGKSGTHCMFFDNCSASTDITGTRDRFLTKTYDFTNATSANLTFDVASTYLILNSTTYTDSLAVLVSTNCGTTWSTIYYKGGVNLSTAPNLTAAAPTCFTPTSSQWRNESVNLSSVLGQSSVMFAFENRSDWAEGMYVDNINITAVTGIADFNSHNGFNLYPNPVASSVTIEGTSKADRIHYSICNMIGAEIKSGDIASSGNYKATIQVSDISTGMYFIKVIDGDSSFTKKLNKQ